MSDPKQTRTTLGRAGAGASIHVCPLSAMPNTVLGCRATHVVTLLREPDVPTPSGILAANHLRILVHDITAPWEGLIHPTEQHVAELLGFIEGWDLASSMVIHCWAGISRSTAAAYIALCRVNPEADEAALAALLRRQSETAMPNALLIAIADDMLGRRGRMVDAVRSMGAGVAASEGAPFALPVRPF